MEYQRYEPVAVSGALGGAVGQPDGRPCSVGGYLLPTLERLRELRGYAAAGRTDSLQPHELIALLCAARFVMTGSGLYQEEEFAP